MCFCIAVRSCLLVVHDTKNVYSEHQMLILNSEHGNGKTLLFFYIYTDKNYCFTLDCLYVLGQCSRVLSLGSFISVDKLITTVDVSPH